MMKAFWKFVDGHKTKIVAYGAGIATVVQLLGYTVPEWVWMALAAAGLGAIRSAIRKTEK